MSRIDVADDVVGERVAVLDERDRTREGAPVTCAERSDESLARPVPAIGHGRMLRSAAAGERRLGTGPAQEHVRGEAADRDEPGGQPVRPARADRRDEGPATTIASPSNALLTLIITVNARPRSASGVQRCTITTCHARTSARCRTPQTTIASAAIQMFGATAAPSAPDRQGRNASG